MTALTHSSQKILLIRPSALGDVCRTVPLASALKARFPNSELHWIVQSGLADAVRHHPAVDRVVSFDRSTLGSTLKKGNAGPFRAFVRALRQEHYDLVIDAQGLFRSAAIARLTGARHRIGHADAREMGWMFYTQAVPSSGDSHTVDRMMSLVESLTCDRKRDMRLHTSPEDREHADSLLEHQDTIVFAPTTRWPAKIWPTDRWPRLASQVLAHTNARITVIGAPSERDQCQPLLDLATQDPRIIDLVGKTNIGIMMAIIARSRLVVAHDSAAAHIAVGFDRPLVALFGPTRVDRVGPYRRDHDVIQHLRPGDRINHKSAEGSHITARISVEEVVRACLLRLDSSRHPPATA